MLRIIYADEFYFKSFAETLDVIAREEVYLEMVQAPSFEEVCDFQSKLIQQKLPVFYALYGEKVIGWVDIAVSKNPRLCHRGTLGMGLLKEHRGQGIGSELMAKAIQYSKEIGLEKLELQVYTSNIQALGLYKKYGFKEVGTIHKYRKYKGRFFDSIFMELLF